MMNVRHWLIIGLHTVAALSLGAGTMRLFGSRKWPSEGAGSAASPAFPAPSRQPVENGESAAMALLGTVGRDPYAKLSDGAIATIAASLDMTKENSWRLLNAVISPDLCRSLWDACIRGNIGKISLQELMAIAKHGAGRNLTAVYGGIFDAIYKGGSEEKELTTQRGKGTDTRFFALHVGAGGELR
jgi:hypothetical protein